MMLRYKLATPWLGVHRILASVRRTPGGFRILVFHDVPSTDLPAFERLVDYLAERHSFLSPEDAAALMRGDETPALETSTRPPCLLSFDDGFVSNHTVAAEVLNARNIKALFFIPPGLVEMSGDQQRKALAENVFQGRILPAQLGPELRLMTWDEINELSRAGHAIGCHGQTHQRLSTLSSDMLEEEIGLADSLLTDRLGQGCPWYAFAFGDIGSISDAALGKIASLFNLCRSGVRGANRPGISPFALRADHLPLDAPFAYQKLIVEGGLDPRYGNQRHRLDEYAASIGE
ncbi:MAG: polysaccharide deacetylase family protein [Rhodospirillaceae bacterium]|jgi:peptidoglycan/xylan/chitin deacetylase (PgdA/CDA1 family)|nr:polysaccharide deacetylase family protein [Rhodospirillaceae bacterium]